MNQPAMRRITQLINKHGPLLIGQAKQDFLSKAADQWAAAVQDQPLPAIDTSVADKRQKELVARQRQSTVTSSTKNSLPDNLKAKKKGPVPTGKHGRPLLKMKPRKEGDTRSLSPFVKIIEKKNGTKWMYVTGMDGKVTVKQLDQYFVPTYVEQDNAEKGEQSKQPAKADTKGDQKTMEKAHAEKTISRWGRNTTFDDIRQDVAGVSLQQPASMPVPQTFGKTLLQQAMTAPAPAMNGHQQAAARCGLDISTPGLENMTFDDMKKLAAQQQLDVANSERGRLGLPPLQIETPKTKARKATWSSM